MSQSLTDAKTATTAGFAALKRNEPGLAREHFERATASGAAGPEAWYGLSQAHRVLGDVDQEGAALDRVLGIDAYNLQALIAKGDWHGRRNNTRTAASFYETAVEVAGTIRDLPPYWRAEVERIVRNLQQAARVYEAHLRGAIADKGIGRPGTERFAHSLEMLIGTEKLYLPKPTHFFFSGLPQMQFYEREMFAWAQALEAETGAIREELLSVLAGDEGIEPYIVSLNDRPNVETLGLLDDPSWSAFHLWRFGAPVAANAARVPRTMAALEKVPLARVDGRSPSALFSILRPGTRIRPHHGFTNTRLICHLPLVVPPNCGGLRCGSETRGWQEGRLMMFDDSVEHEAWNDSDKVRVVLLFDIWKPELSEIERDLVATMLATIDKFGNDSPKED